MSDLIQEEISKVIKKHNVFFCFSNEQFDEQKEVGVKYVDMGAGCVCPKYNVKEYMSDMDAALNSGINKDIQKNGVDGIIRREYFNYECQITMDTTDLIDALDSYINKFPELFTQLKISEVSRCCFNEAMKNDLF